MTATEWERHGDGQHISIPIPSGDADEVRKWCGEHCLGDYMVVLGRRVVFQLAEDAAIATLWWRAEER